MAADGLQEVNKKEFADLQSRCRVNIMWCNVYEHFYTCIV